MIPKLQNKRIGEVNIFELQGVYTEPWVERIKREMEEVVGEDPQRGLLVNVNELQRIDPSGASAILDTARHSMKTAFLGYNPSTRLIAEQVKPEEEIQIFKRGREAVKFFEKEFAAGDEGASQERRRYPRTKVALPVEMEMKGEGPALLLEGVVTNLSQGGFYCYLLDSQTEERAAGNLDPFDFKLMQIWLGLPKGRVVETEGKVLRVEKESSRPLGIAAEFYNLGAEEGERIRFFLKGEAE